MADPLKPKNWVVGLHVEDADVVGIVSGFDLLSAPDFGQTVEEYDRVAEKGTFIDGNCSTSISTHTIFQNVTHSKCVLEYT